MFEDMRQFGSFVVKYNVNSGSLACGPIRSISLAAETPRSLKLLLWHSGRVKRTALQRYSWSALVAMGTLFYTTSARADFAVDTPEVSDLLFTIGQPVDAGDLPPRTPVSTEFIDEGYTLLPFMYYNPDSSFFGAPTQVGNFNNVTDDHLETFTISFNEPVSDAGFLMWIADDAVVEFTTYLDGEVVETATLVNPTLDPPRIVGFVNTEIDAIQVEVGDERTIIDGIFFVAKEGLSDDCDRNGDGESNFIDLLIAWNECKAEFEGVPGVIQICLEEMSTLTTLCSG